MKMIKKALFMVLVRMMHTAPAVVVANITTYWIFK